MTPLTDRLVRIFCCPDRREELLGDLAELRARPGRGPIQEWTDAVSLCLLQSRVRAWRAREWSRATIGVGVTLLVFAAAPIGATRMGPHTITASDAAGVFTLVVENGRVLAATMDGFPISGDRIEVLNGRIRLRADDPIGDLVIEMLPDGGIRWDGRDGRPVPQQEATPIELAWAREYFAEIGSVGEADGGRLWGRVVHGPLFFVDPETRFLAANVPDLTGVLEERDGLWVGSLPEDENIANTAVEWAGRRWSMVMWPLPSDRYARQKLIFHELFHRLQPDLGIPMRDPPNDHLAARDGRIWLRLELRALGEALIRRGEARLAAIEDALVFRARRHALYPGAANSERVLELNEGLAEYTGLVMSGLPSWVLADRAAVELGRREQQENLSRSFAYGSGPAYAILLDESGVAWRDGVDAGTDLSELLREAAAVGAVSDAGAEARADRYAGGRIIAQEQRAAARAAALDAELRERFLEGPTLTIPVAGEFRYSFNPDGATPLGGAGTVYGRARVTDEWGILEVTSGGVLLARPGRSIVEVVVPLPAPSDAAPVSGDGWQLDLAEGWVLEPGSLSGSWVARRR